VLAHGIATQYSQNVEAIATVGSSIPLGLRYPVRGVSVFMINGTQDPIVSYSGGNGLISARDSSTFWANANLCDRYISLEEADPSYDGTRVIKETYNHGRDESEVTLVTIEGGGHTWPGGPQFPSEFGTTCTHFDATGEIWKFFKKH
jgi:polyhydroxybutyrate depolymerase